MNCLSDMSRSSLALGLLAVYVVSNFRPWEAASSSANLRIDSTSRRLVGNPTQRAASHAVPTGVKPQVATVEPPLSTAFTAREISSTLRTGKVSTTGNLLEPLSQLLTVVAAAAVAWTTARGTKAQRWAMASTGGPADVKASSSSALKNLESLLSTDEETSDKSSVAETSKLTDGASQTLKRMYRSMGADETDSSESREIKTVLVDLEKLIDTDKPNDAPASSETTKDTDKAPEAKSAADVAETKPEVPRGASGPVLDGVRVEALIAGLMTRIPETDIRKMKEEVLAPSGFKVTLAEDAFEVLNTGFTGGHLFRGRPRGEVADVVKAVELKMKEVFGTKYELLILPEPPRYDESFPTSPEDVRPPAFMLIPPAEIKEAPEGGLQYALAGLLLVLTLFSSSFVGFGKALSALAPDQFKALVTAADTEASLDIMLANVPTILSVLLPVGGGLVAAALLHEAGHRLAALKHNVKLGPGYLLPNVTLGSLGAITRIRGMVPSNAALFDVAAAGPLAGGAVSLLMFLIGLGLTSSASATDPMILLPTSFVQSSVLLGSVLKAVAGSASVRCHPLVFAGWCGLVTTALSALPIGSTDGGRIMQAIVGRRLKQVAGFLILLSLSFNAIAPGIGFSWAITSIFLTGDSERNVRDQYTTLDPARRAVGTAMIFLAALTLVPLPGGLIR